MMGGIEPPNQKSEYVEHSKKRKIKMIIIIFTPWQLLTSTLADGLSLKFVWQHVSPSL